jgi:hypothetical protein
MNSTEDNSDTIVFNLIKDCQISEFIKFLKLKKEKIFEIKNANEETGKIYLTLSFTSNLFL